MTIRGFKAHTVRDQIRFLCNPARVRVPAFRVIERIQDCTPGEQILGTAVALVAMTQSAGIHLDDVMRVAFNLMNDAEAPFTSHLKAVRDYAVGEIARGEETTRGATVEAVEAALRGEYERKKVITYGR